MSGVNLIAYRRVSTARQGASGLGLEGQESAVAEYARAAGGNVLRAYTEIETGKRSNRPELARALADCRRSKAVLVIAKLDRLARNVHFLSGLMEAGVEFVCCDMPSANRLTLHIMAAVAEDEAKRISERTKAALAAYKARGGVLGAARPGAYRVAGGANPKAAKRAGEVAKAHAVAAYSDLAPLLGELRAEGLSLRQIARRLNLEGHTTRRGKSWNQVQIMRVIKCIGLGIVMANVYLGMMGNVLAKTVQSEWAACQSNKIRIDEHDIMENHPSTQISAAVAQEDYESGGFDGEAWREINPEEFYLAYNVDLNGDGIPEILIQAGEYEENGKIIRYDNGKNSSVWIYELSKGKPQLLLKDVQHATLNSGYPLILKMKTNGYNDVCTFIHKSVNLILVKHYKFNRNHYEIADCTEELFGSESENPVSVRKIMCKNFNED